MADKPDAFLPLPLPSIGDAAPSPASELPTASAVGGIGEEVDPALEEVGQDFETTKARIREIEAKALRMLRHPARSARLQAFVDGGDDDDDENDENDEDADDDE